MNFEELYLRQFLAIGFSVLGGMALVNVCLQPEIAIKHMNRKTCLKDADTIYFPVSE